MVNPRPEDMRRAMGDYVRAVHRAYVAQADLQPPAVAGRMPLIAAGSFTVAAAGVQNLHVIGTVETFAAPRAPEVATDDAIDSLRWTVRFYDPVVLPSLGLIDEQRGPSGDQVRRALGITTYLYHLVVQPGGQLTEHHASHAGAGLANAHAAGARDFEAIRAHAGGRAPLVDEMEGAAVAGLQRAHALLARELVPWDDGIAELVSSPKASPDELRRAVLAALRGPGGG